MTLLQMQERGRQGACELAKMQVLLCGQQSAAFLFRGMVEGFIRVLRVIAGPKETAEYLYRLADREIDASNSGWEPSQDMTTVCQAIDSVMMEPTHG